MSYDDSSDESNSPSHPACPQVLLGVHDEKWILVGCRQGYVTTRIMERGRPCILAWMPRMSVESTRCLWLSLAYSRHHVCGCAGLCISKQGSTVCIVSALSICKYPLGRIVKPCDWLMCHHQSADLNPKYLIQLPRDT